MSIERQSIPTLIPRPAEFAYAFGVDAFTFDAATPIHLAQTATDDTVFAARELQQAVQRATGLVLPLRKGGLASGGVALTVVDGDAAEEYTLNVAPTGI